MGESYVSYGDRAGDSAATADLRAKIQRYNDLAVHELQKLTYREVGI